MLSLPSCQLLPNRAGEKRTILNCTCRAARLMCHGCLHHPYAKHCMHWDTGAYRLASILSWVSNVLGTLVCPQLPQHLQYPGLAVSPPLVCMHPASHCESGQVRLDPVMQPHVMPPCWTLSCSPAGPCHGALLDPVMQPCWALSCSPAGPCHAALLDPVMEPCWTLSWSPAGPCHGALLDPVMQPCWTLSCSPAGPCHAALLDPVMEPCWTLS